ncbi:protein of unknown function [Aquiflexum balticum DSM 16537]|uniref:DUF4402 domain-containing protein n=1 Tax=Aquiflexum balticum DSM 16537 TaxID=758820 RepID=A0A1W2H902_9BACT|nr:DUF4402 domain-containing protein [Aquiflexum balticum]SMD45337.1 protein of unknown function [Aquiflexum balticum DSM 16537]
MKTTIKSLVVALFLVGLSNVAFAQKTATANAAAEVLQDLEINLDATLNEINFGRISATTPGTVILDANDAANNQNTGSITNVARFQLVGANGGVTVFYDGTVVLNSGPDNITMTTQVVGDSNVANRASAIGIASGSTVTLVGNDYYLWIGGSLPALAGQETGNYTGTFNISAEYN